MALAGATRSGLWYVERGWTIILGGCFAAVTLRWPERRFLPRALLAIAVAGAGAWAALGLSPRRWAIIDRMVATRLRDGVSTSLEALRVLRDGTPLPGTVISTVFQAAEWQSNLFPAMLGLSSLAALGAAWWLYVRLVRGSGEGLGPLRDFRFNDQLVWLLVAGAVMFVLQRRRRHGPGRIEPARLYRRALRVARSWRGGRPDPRRVRPRMGPACARLPAAGTLSVRGGTADRAGRHLGGHPRPSPADVTENPGLRGA